LSSGTRSHSRTVGTTGRRGFDAQQKRPDDRQPTDHHR
jgi:hypothetical protein